MTRAPARGTTATRIEVNCAVAGQMVSAPAAEIGEFASSLWRLVELVVDDAERQAGPG